MDFMKEYEKWLASPALSAAEKAELEAIRRRGYSLDKEELEKGICCIAAPVFNSLGEPQMAISASFLTARFLSMDVEATARSVMYFADQISRKLGAGRV